MSDLQLVVPAGWVLIDPRTGECQPDLGVDLVGVDLVDPARLASLAEAGAYALLLAVAPVYNQMLNAAITVLPLVEVEGSTALDVVLAMAATHEGATLSDIDGAVALRLVEAPDQTPPGGDRDPELTEQDTSEVGEPDPTQAQATLTRSVRYLMGWPGTDRWLDLQLLVERQDANAAMADAVVTLFDAWAKTVRWPAPEPVS